MRMRLNAPTARVEIEDRVYHAERGVLPDVPPADAAAIRASGIASAAGTAFRNTRDPGWVCGGGPSTYWSWTTRCPRCGRARLE